MLLAGESATQQTRGAEERVWPLRGSLIVFASIVYIMVLLA